MPVFVTRIGLLAATVAVASIAAVSTPAKAQDDIRKRGAIACKSSSNHLCSKFFGQGDMAILACLQQNKVRLAASCRKFLTEIGQLQ
ncbi:MAG: hypothetical protein ACXWI5_12225 [Croceibacterium sp.]